MSASSMGTTAATLGALSLVLVLAACGGSDGEASTTVAADTTATPAAANARLDQASWSRYQDTRAHLRKVNDEAIETFRSCRRLLGSEVPAEKVQECLGDSAASVVVEGKQAMAVLDDLAQEVSGPCADATAQLSGNVKLYTATINGIQRSVDRGSLPTSQEVESALGLLTASRAAAAEFERACKPAA
jgi:hypothetical protein